MKRSSADALSSDFVHCSIKRRKMDEHKRRNGKRRRQDSHKKRKKTKRESKVQELTRLLRDTQNELKHCKEEKLLLMSFIQECKRNFFEAGISQPGKAFNLVSSSVTVH